MKTWAAIALAPLVLVVALIPVLGGNKPDPSCSPAGTSLTANLPGHGVGSWSTEQVNNAAQLITVGEQMNMPARAQTLIVAAAMDESNLIPKGQIGLSNAGGRAYGILQQTPFESGGTWGSIAEVMDIGYAARGFYSHLIKVPGWQTMAPTLAIHAVQRNADPMVYAPFWGPATELVAAITRDSSTTASTAPSAPAGSPASATAQPVDVTAVDDVMGCGSADGFTTAAVITGGGDHVGPYGQAQLIDRVHQLAASGYDWQAACQHFAGVVSGRGSSGYATATDAWASFVASGVGHKANDPDGHTIPVGAWTYFDTSNSAGHVAVFIGDQGGQPMVASTDMSPEGKYSAGDLNIVPMSAVEAWGPYLGWAAPWGQKVTVQPAATPAAAATTPASSPAAASSPAHPHKGKRS